MHFSVYSSNLGHVEWAGQYIRLLRFVHTSLSLRKIVCVTMQTTHVSYQRRKNPLLFNLLISSRENLVAAFSRLEDELLNNEGYAGTL